MSEEEEDIITSKIFFVGESGVGCNSIKCRYIDNIFHLAPITILSCVYNYKIEWIEEEKQSIKFEIWNGPGQEKYRDFLEIYYKNSDVVILVYDITSKYSFEKLKNYYYSRMIKLLQKDVSKKSNN